MLLLTQKCTDYMHADLWLETIFKYFQCGDVTVDICMFLLIKTGLRLNKIWMKNRSRCKILFRLSIEDFSKNLYILTLLVFSFCIQALWLFQSYVLILWMTFFDLGKRSWIQAKDSFHSFYCEDTARCTLHMHIHPYSWIEHFSDASLNKVIYWIEHFLIS